MFMGSYQHALDPKGRVTLPSVFREKVEGGVVITVGIDNCLAIRPVAEWERFTENLRELQTTDERARMAFRSLFGSAHADTVDRQGRVTIPAPLREYARLQRDVTLVGADTFVELWDSENWQIYRAKAMAAYATTNQPFAAVGGRA